MNGILNNFERTNRERFKQLLRLRSFSGCLYKKSVYIILIQTVFTVLRWLPVLAKEKLLFPLVCVYVFKEESKRLLRGTFLWNFEYMFTTAIKGVEDVLSTTALIFPDKQLRCKGVDTGCCTADNPCGEVN